MFPCEDSEIESVRLSVRTPRQEISLALSNISPTLVIDVSIKRSSRVLQHRNKKIDFLKKKNAYLSVSAVMFYKEFLAYTLNIDRSAFSCYP